MSEINSINEREGPAKNTSGMAQMDLSGMLGKLLANPQIIESVASALSSENESGASHPQNSAPPMNVEQKNEQITVEPPTPDIAAMAQRLPEIMGMLSPVLQQKGGASSDKAHIVSDKRACLLNAMKPYMSPQRCEAIDYIIKFSQISEILKKIN